jgi:Uma2 family endonuclease
MESGMENAGRMLSSLVRVPLRAEMVRASKRDSVMMRRSPDPPPGDERESSCVQALGPGGLAALDALVEASEQARVEVIDGILYELPMTSFEHGHVVSLVVAVLVPAYQLGRGGPGGWWIQGENDFSANGREVFRPDAIGWRRERLAGIDRARRVEVVPDWVCEVLSPSTRTHDVDVKARAYARIGVRYGWYVDPLHRELTVYELCDSTWNVVGVYGKGEAVCAPPFGGIELELRSLFAEASLP